MATTNLKFHRITATAGNTINTSTAYVKGDVYFIKSASGNTGKVYICTTAGTGTAAVLEDYSVDTNTNTWRGIQDNLTSTSTTDSLSAKQGKILFDTINENEEVTAQTFNDINGRVSNLETASGNHVTLSTTQTITAKKTFNAGIAIGSCTLAYDATNKCLKFNFA